ncbi:MAG: ATP-dependent DNA helicase RecG [Planctomycetaceae bacterium]|nr:ATP-dependent DNA helicase RecG [Planctomycetaceae bacterium]
MDRSDNSDREALTTPVQFLPGVGPERGALLERMGLRIAQDLLFFFPRDYQDLSELCAIADLTEGRAVSVMGTVAEVKSSGPRWGRSRLWVTIHQEHESLRGVWYNQSFLRKKFQPGQHVLFAGETKRNGTHWEITHPQIQFLADGERPTAGDILPIYSLTDGIKQHQMRRIVKAVVSSTTALVDEVLPEAFRVDHNLWPIDRALAHIHAPGNQDALQNARRRFIYQELLVMQLALARRRWLLSNEHSAPSLPPSARIDSRIQRLFPFSLTADQQQAIDDICQDMARSIPMNRLLQGDVGSGKTVVAEYAMLLAVAHGHQAVLMAPTEVLARQHWRTLTADLERSKVRIALLTGTLPSAQRREHLADLERGAIDLVIGTQAVLQETVRFSRLGLVVIDEQHRFGVNQRAALRQSGMDPHYLVMTATPIPRTIAMTLYGDLDVSTLVTLPPGRQPVHTRLADTRERDQWWRFFCEQLRTGRQGYVVVPRVEDTDQDIASVEATYEQLANGPLEAFRVGLVHGRLSSEEKDAAMRAFSEGQLQVLIATSVVEVGINVPNATLMTIENGDRFGLAQLHQLRGRIRRGAHPGYVCVFVTDISSPRDPRLEAFVASTNGFELAEKDFELRGPGNLFGSAQHGMPPLRIADLQRDSALLDEARRDARALIAQDPQLRNSELERLRRMVGKRYGRVLKLGDVA